MKSFFRNNGLSIVLFGLFFFCLLGQYFTGWNEYNDSRREHGSPQVDLIGYLGEGHFIEAVFENWESEFLQMGMYVILTIFLFQKGSSESKTPEAIETVDVVPNEAGNNKEVRFPVKRGSVRLKIYQNSLSLAFFFLFFVSFALHAVGGAKDYNQEQIEHGEKAITTFEYLETSRFWFESFQNWQSEFLSIGAMVVLTIFLRQKGSPESKAVFSSNDDTGK